MVVGVVLRQIEGERERDMVARWWSESFAGRSKRVRCGRGELSRSLWGHAHRGIVDHLLDRAVTLIAEVDGEPLGFVCYEQSRDSMLLHYVFVVGEARARGVGGHMLAVARASLGEMPIVATHTTYAGAMLLAATQARMEAKQ